jgi:dihydroflavonol-4-reductase
MRFLITGASGFVGGNLARMLVERGHQVTALVRRSSKVEELKKIPSIEFAFCDFNTGEGLEAAVEKIDVVIHAAGVTKARTPEEYHRGNAEGTRLLCAALSRQKKPAKLVFCSSLAAAGPATAGKPRTEKDECAPVSIYGRSKLGGEMAVREFCDRVPSVIVRPPVVYGPGDFTNVPPLFPMAKLGVYVKPGFSPKFLSFVHVTDLCEGLIAAAEKGKTLSKDDPAEGVYFISDPREYSYEDFFTAFSTALGKKKPRVLPLPEMVGYAVGLTNELAGRLVNSIPIMNRDKAFEMSREAWTCSPQRAAQELDFQPVHSLEGGLVDTVAWYRREGWLR